jgi:hypothetical protein
MKRFIDEVLGGPFDINLASSHFDSRINYLQEREWSEPFYLENTSNYSFKYEGEVLKGTKIPLGRGRMII